MNKLKMTVLAAITSATLSGNANASGIPTTDYAQLGSQIMENMRAMFEHEEVMLLWEKSMEHMGTLQEMLVDGENNAWANVVIRTNNARQDIQNLEIAAKSTPAVNSTAALSPAIVTFCIDGVDVMNKENADNEIVDEEEAAELRKAGIEVKTNLDKQKELIDRAIGGDGVCSTVDNETGDIASALNPRQLITSSSASLTLTEKQSVAIDDYIDLVSPPYIASYRDKSIRERSNEVQVKMMEEDAEKSFSRVVLQKIMSKRSGDTNETGMSQLQLLDWFAEEHFGNGFSAHNKISGKIMTSNLANPSVVWRNIAVMRAFDVHMSVLEYKSDLNREVMQAITLGRKVKNYDNNQ